MTRRRVEARSRAIVIPAAPEPMMHTSASSTVRSGRVAASISMTPSLPYQGRCAYVKIPVYPWRPVRGYRYEMDFAAHEQTRAPTPTQAIEGARRPGLNAVVFGASLLV